MASRKTTDNEIGLSASFYIENASTGRFRRCSDRDTRGNSRNFSEHQNTILAAEHATDRVINVLPVMSKAAFVCFLFLQGILSGLSLSALYEALTPQQPEEFFSQYSATRANEIRRYFFIGITFCATGSLCSINKHEITQVLASMTGGSSPNSTTKASTSICYLILTYFLALIITVVCSHVDVRLLDVASHMNEQDTASADDFRSVLHKLRGLSIPRSVFCIVGWFISCYRFFISRNNIQRETVK